MHIWPAHIFATCRRYLFVQTRTTSHPLDNMRNKRFYPFGRLMRKRLKWKRTQPDFNFTLHFYIVQILIMLLLYTEWYE